MIDRRSRYARTPTLAAPDARGEPLTLLELRVPDAQELDVTYAPAAGERLDHVAQRFYQDATAFWRICDAADALDPFDVVAPGRALDIPTRR